MALCYNRLGGKGWFQIYQMNNDNSGIFSYLEQEKIRASRVPHALAIAASTVIVLAGIQAAGVLVGPVLLALFLAVILLVPLRWLQLHGCPHFLAFLFVLFCTIVLFVGITYFVSQSLTKFVRTIPGYTKQVVEQYNDFNVQLEKWGFMIVGRRDEKNPQGQENIPTDQTSGERLQRVEHVLPAPLLKELPPVVSTQRIIDKEHDTEDTGISLSLLDIDEENVDEVPPYVEIVPTETLEEVADWIQRTVQKEPSLIALEPAVLAAWLAKAMLYVRGMLEGGFLVLIFTIFMLFEASYFPAKVTRAFGQDSPLRLEHFHRIAEDIRRYLFLKTLANLMSGSAAMFVYYMFGVPAFFFWGIIAFFMYYIPNIGGTLAAVIPGVLILVAPPGITGGVSGVLLYAVCLLTIECTIAYGIEPKILGHGLRLSTLVIILSLFFWGFLLGPIGLFLAAPLTVMIKIILQAFPETRWLAIFLDGGREKH